MTLKVGIYKDGKLQAKATNENKALMKIHRLQGQSVSYALKYGGWSIRDLPKRKR